MKYLNFDKTQLINLEYSLSKEILRTNRGGAFSLTTIIGCNTRKYHGLLICPVPQLEDHRFVLLSSFDESIIKDDTEFNLGLHKYSGDNYSPKGHKYVDDFYIENVVGIIYKVGDVTLRKESIMVDQEDQILIKYTLEESPGKIRLRFKPFLAFRNIHELSKANLYINTRIDNISNGIKSCLYEEFPFLHMQFSKKTEFIQVPDWYYNIEYMEELKRGYDYQEDLFVPGYFELDLNKGESIIFSASTKKIDPKELETIFSYQASQRIKRENFEDCLLNAANQFFVQKGDSLVINAGYPWFSVWGRDTFLALPGLAHSSNNKYRCKYVLISMLENFSDGLFPNLIVGESMAYNSVDAPLLFIRALQLCNSSTNMEKWEIFGEVIKSILSSYKKGLPNIKMHDNGLIYAGNKDLALTWMDALVDNKPVTPRTGYQVEINALWYNAISYSLEIAKEIGDSPFINEWDNMPKLIKESYTNTFWDNDKKYLADHVSKDEKNWQVRPNMIIATALKYSPLDREKKIAILDICTKELLTDKGLRTLSPKDVQYCGIYEGSQKERDKAYHQGTVWPWLLEFYCETYLELHGKDGIPFIKEIVKNFEPEIKNHGIGTISEIYDGDPPHKARGAISQAWSVSALLKIIRMIKENS